MCGRYALFTDPRDLADEFGLADAEYDATYNAAPGQELPVVLDDDPEALTSARWGLVPSWSDGPGRGPDPINARAETLAENRLFADAYRERRCLVPVDGFYEWAETDGGKRPYFVSRADDRPFLLAGLWETWTPSQRQTGLGEFDAGGPDGDAVAGERDAESVRSSGVAESVRSSGVAESVRSFTVVTTEPNDFLAEYHDRMAVVLDRGLGERWLSADDPRGLLEPRAFDLEARPVSRDVNDPSNDHPGLVESVA